VFLAEAGSRGFSTCLNAEAASIRAANTAGTNAHTTYGRGHIKCMVVFVFLAVSERQSILQT